MRCLTAWLLFALAGCTSMPDVQYVQRPCTELMPDAPRLYTQQLGPDVQVDAWVRAASAEILEREAYEVELRAALYNCTR